MSSKSEELRRCQMKCAELEDVVEMLEREIKRLTSQLKSSQEANRHLAIMMAHQTTMQAVAKAKQAESPEKKNESKEDEKPETKTSTSSEDDRMPSEEKPSDKKDTVKTGDEISVLEEGEENPFGEDDECPFEYTQTMEASSKAAKPQFKSYKEKIAYECQEFLKKYSFSAFYNEISKDIIGQEAALKKILALIYNYIYTISTGKTPERCNTALLTAPSGNGKSALFKSLKAFFLTEIPSLVCSRKDVSRVTPEGYRGLTVNTILSDFIPYEKRTVEQQYGILWLDEFDKMKFNHDEGPQVQNQILSFMDGQVERYSNITIDTRSIFWVATGSFNEVRQKKQQSVEKTIGFLSENKCFDTFDDITREDMLTLFSYETVGRFNLIVNFKRLSETAVLKVIAKTLESISKDLRIDAALGTEYAETLVKSANSGFGCRKIYSTLYETCLQAYITILQGGIYGINEMPLVVIEGPEDFTIIDEDVGNQIVYQSVDED